MSIDYATESAGPPIGEAVGWRARVWPAWFRTLFLSDLLERFGYYGMQAVLVLYASAPRHAGGLGLAETDATALFGAWIGLSFMLCLPGGLVADRLLGSRRALLIGSTVTALGYLTLALPLLWTAPVGLVLLAVGAGLYKPNYQALLSQMYGADRSRREAGISLIYVGIQFSALCSPLLVGFLGERVDWHLGFAVCGLSAALGTAQFAYSTKQFNGTGEQPGRPVTPAAARRAGRRTALWAAGPVVLVAGGVAVGGLGPTDGIKLVGMLSLIMPAIGYRAVYRNGRLTGADRCRLRSFLWLFLGSTLFWSLISQTGSTLTLFARDSTDRQVFGLTVPVSWLQAATPLFILVLAPVFAWVLPRFGRGPTGVPVKFSLGLLLSGASFLLMSLAAALAGGGHRVSPGWLLLVYLMHACGELIVAAVGIAAVADVLPRAFISQMLGLLWLFAALGGGAGSQLGRLIGVVPESVYYLSLGLAALLFGAALALRRAAVARGLAVDVPTRSVATATAATGT